MAASIPVADIDTIVFACEAGIGSSIMGVNAFKRKLKQANLSIAVMHKPVRSVAADAKVVIAHKGLAEFARKQAPNAVVIAFSQFINDPVFDRVINELKAGGAVTEAR